MKETAQNTRQFVERWAAKHPNDPDLPLMGQFAGLGGTLFNLRTQAVQPQVASTGQEAPTKAQATSKQETPARLEPVIFKLEIPTVSVEEYTKTREAVENAGYNFVVPIRSVSVKELIAEDRAREGRGEARRLGFVNDSRRMRAVVPPEMEVAINPTKFRIEESNNLPTDDQKRRIKQEQAILRDQVPNDIRHLVNIEMVDPSTLSQLENAYMDVTEGQLFLPDWFARTDVQTVRGRAAGAGRFDPSERRSVIGWDRDRGHGVVFGASVVVLPRKLAA